MISSSSSFGYRIRYSSRAPWSSSTAAGSVSVVWTIAGSFPEQLDHLVQTLVREQPQMTEPLQLDRATQVAGEQIAKITRLQGQERRWFGCSHRGGTRHVQQ